VTIERRVDGRWLSRRRLRTNGDGRFRGPAPSGSATLRAAVPAQEGYPYARGVSRPVRLP
jgi:hypothetical protein